MYVTLTSTAILRLTWLLDRRLEEPKAATSPRSTFDNAWTKNASVIVSPGGGENTRGSPPAEANNDEMYKPRSSFFRKVGRKQRLRVTGCVIQYSSDTDDARPAEAARRLSGLMYMRTTPARSEHTRPPDDGIVHQRDREVSKLPTSRGGEN